MTQKTVLREPKPGDTLFCWKEGETYIAHQNMFYLGTDRSGKEKVLVKSRQLGWDIILLSTFPEDSFRSLGRQHIHEEEFGKKGAVLKIIFVCWIDWEPLYITVKLRYGFWTLERDFGSLPWCKINEAEAI